MRPLPTALKGLNINGKLPMGALLEILQIVFGATTSGNNRSRRPSPQRRDGYRLRQADYDFYPAEEACAEEIRQKMRKTFYNFSSGLAHIEWRIV
jgi:hypothetical protein